MECVMFVAPDGLVSVIGRPAPRVQRPVMKVDRLALPDLEVMAERRYVRLLAAFMQVRHATYPFATVQG